MRRLASAALAAVLFVHAALAQQGTVSSSPPGPYTNGQQPGLSLTPWAGLREQLNLAGTDIGVGQKTMSQSVPVAIASDQGPLSIAPAPSSSASFGITPAVGGSAASSQVLKAGAGNLYGAYAVCTAACWLMVFNATSAPSNGATTAGNSSGNLQDCIPVSAGGYASIGYGLGPPEVFSAGITAVISSTACASLTLSTVGFIHGAVE